MKDKRLITLDFMQVILLQMPSPPPAPLPPMSTGHRFIPSKREAGELQSIPPLCFRVATIATLAFSIHLLLRYLKIRSPTSLPPSFMRATINAENIL